MGIAGLEPRQLAPTVRTTGAGSTDSPAQHQPCHRGTASMLIGVSIQSPLLQIDCPSNQLFVADLTCLVLFCMYAHHREIKLGRSRTRISELRSKKEFQTDYKQYTDQVKSQEAEADDKLGCDHARPMSFPVQSPFLS
jgi:hypothetical protein